MKKRTTVKFILTTIINFGIAMLLSLSISYWYKYNLKDVLFIVGLFTLLIIIIAHIYGNSNNLSISSAGDLNSQYVSNVDFKATEHEKIEDRPEVNFKAILTSTLLLTSILCLIASYFL